METTLTLRNRLGFNEVTLWKQFCARRLHLIHTLSLNLRKASEQEEQVRVLAAELCAEYGFGPYAQTDFEKLLIAGIQSVRRNQKRSARHPHGYKDTSTVESGSKPNSTRADSGSEDSSLQQSNKANNPMVATVFTPMNVNGGGRDSQYYEGASPMHDSSASSATAANSASDHISTNAAVSDRPSQPSSGGLYPVGSSMSRVPPGGPLATPMFQSLVIRLEVLRDMIGAGTATWIESSAPAVAHMSAFGVLSTAVAAASVHGKLTLAESTAMRDSILEGPLLESLRLALDPELSRNRLLERIGALAASLVHGPHLLSALQALCVSLAQASHGSENDMRYMLRPLCRTDRKDADENKHSQDQDGHLQQQQHDQQLQQQQQHHAQQLMQPHPAPPSIQVITPQSHPQASAQLPHHMTASMAPHQQILMPAPMPQGLMPMHQQPMAQGLSPHHAYAQQPPGVPHPVPQYIFQQVPTVQGTNVSPVLMNGKNTTGENTPASIERKNSDTGASQINSGVYSPPQSASPEATSNFNSVSSSSSLVSAASSVSSGASAGIQVGGPDRLVTLQFNDKTLSLTYSPMKATPPTISEIIDNARQSFSISPSTCVRIKDLQRNKVIETNAELIDAFTQEQVKLVLLLPPPMLTAMEPKLDFTNKEAKFTPLAPIFRKST